MGKRESARITLPGGLRPDTARVIGDIVKALRKGGGLSACDLPQIHRMASAYDVYARCFETLSREGMTATNAKGETVKRPEVNIMRENWAQYLAIAREYGLTPRSRRMINPEPGGDGGEPCPLDEFFRGRWGGPRGSAGTPLRRP